MRRILSLLDKLFIEKSTQMADQNNHLYQQPTPIIQSISHKQSLLNVVVPKKRPSTTFRDDSVVAVLLIKLKCSLHMLQVSRENILSFACPFCTLIFFSNILYNWIHHQQGMVVNISFQFQNYLCVIILANLHDNLKFCWKLSLCMILFTI